MRISHGQPNASLACSGLLTAVLVTFAGCAQKPTEPQWSSTAPITALDAKERAKRISTSGWIEEGTHVVAVREGKVQSDITKVAVDITGDTGGTRRFGYRFEWYDAAGMPIGTPTTATTSVAIKVRETITLTSVAPSATASQWRLVLVGK
ncbi:MAG: YcfL family protein [Limnohabitans sp.]|nr:YcfL family protein [Limnohabitans sp.]